MEGALPEPDLSPAPEPSANDAHARIAAENARCALTSSLWTGGPEGDTGDCPHATSARRTRSIGRLIAARAFPS